MCVFLLQWVCQSLCLFANIHEVLMRFLANLLTPLPPEQLQILLLVVLCKYNHGLSLPALVAGSPKGMQS